FISCAVLPFSYVFRSYTVKKQISRFPFFILSKKIDFFESGMCFPSINKLMIQASEVNRNQLTYARFLHCNSVYYIYRGHCHFIMRNNNELRFFTKLPDHLCEFSNVGIIKRRIYLIENTKRCGFYQVDGE